MNFSFGMGTTNLGARNVGLNKQITEGNKKIEDSKPERNLINKSFRNFVEDIQDSLIVEFYIPEQAKPDALNFFYY